MSDNNKSELEKNLKLLYDDIQIEYAIEKQKIDRAINKLNTIRPILILIETIICLFGSVIAGMILNNYIIPNISLIIAIAILAVTVIFMGMATMHLNCEFQSLKDKIATQKINEYKENNIITDDVKILSVLFNKFSE